MCHWVKSSVWYLVAVVKVSFSLSYRAASQNVYSFESIVDSDQLASARS